MQQYKYENIKSIPHLPVYCDQYETYRQMSPSHWHDHLEIIYMIDGRLMITCNEEEYEISKNEFFVINSNKIHGTRSNGTVKALLIQIPYSYMDSYIDKYENVRFRECYENEHEEKNYIQMKKLLKSISHIYMKKENGYELSLMGKINEFLYILYTKYSRVETGVEKESRQISRLKEVLQYVSESYQENVSLKKAADVASLNPEYFCRMFKRCMGVTFLEYVNLVRIDHIHEELLVTDDSITEILERNGFSNYKVFSRMFKEQFGMTPREMRKMSS